MTSNTWDDNTIAVQAGRPLRVTGAPMNEPITLSATYVHTADIGYGRDGNNGWAALERALSQLDGGHAVTFASGLAAATAISSLVPTGGLVVIPQAAYYGVKGIFGALAERGQIRLQLVDASDTDAVIAACDGAAMVWMESIANPTLVVADVPKIVAAAKKAGALAVVDATFATPLRQKPLELGADIVMHSATKFIGGHSDLLLGAVTSQSEEHATAIAAFRHDNGAIPGALESFLALRGLRTMAVRLDRAQANALELAKRLSAHQKVSKVNYPGLEGDSQFDIAQRVLPHGSGAMLSFELASTAEKVDAALEELTLITHATSLGGVESLIERRARYDAELNAGVPETLCRFSVGIEDVDDIWNDLEKAFSHL